MRLESDPLKGTNIRFRAQTIALKRWSHVTGDNLGEAYRDGYEHGYEAGVAYAIERIAKGKSKA